MSDRASIVDISRYNLQRGNRLVEPDWDAVYLAGVRRVVLRALLGDGCMDPAFPRYLAGLRAHGGFRIDAYLGFLPDPDPRLQARTFVDILDATDFPLAEDSILLDDIERISLRVWGAALAERAYVGLNEIQTLTGIIPEIYARASFWNRWVQPAPWIRDFRLMVAHYDPPAGWPTLPRGAADFDHWQYSEHGEIPGFDGRVDLVRSRAEASFPRIIVLVSTGGGRLNVRNGPGLTFDVIRQLQHGDRIAIVDRLAGWGRLEDPVEAWVWMAYTRPA